MPRAGARGTPEAGVNDLQIYCTVDEQKGQGIIFFLKERRKTYIVPGHSNSEVIG